MDTELDYMQAAMSSGKLFGDGGFTCCQQWLEHYSGSKKVLLTPNVSHRWKWLLSFEYSAGG
ncbi:MAG: hypothetical protein ACSLEN_02790 [Candidatus Malihini olakiniferum]